MLWSFGRIVGDVDLEQDLLCELQGLQYPAMLYLQLSDCMALPIGHGDFAFPLSFARVYG